MKIQPAAYRVLPSFACRSIQPRRQAGECFTASGPQSMRRQSNKSRFSVPKRVVNPLELGMTHENAQKSLLHKVLGILTRNSLSHCQQRRIDTPEQLNRV